uniref:Uncharacterized protein n=2 Tax=Plectus sambesii TaxID=2011161 RepID=A0A914XB43_9BILA
MTNTVLNNPNSNCIIQIPWSDTKKLFKDETGWEHFEAVFYTSALTGEGVDDLKEYLIDRAPNGDWRYHSSVMTTKSPQQLCIDCLRGKLLDHLPHNVPYQLDIKVSFWQVDEHDLLKIVLDVQCQKDRHARLLIGTGGERIHLISAETNQELRNLFQREVYLKVAVKYSNGLTAAPQQ